MSSEYSVTYVPGSTRRKRKGLIMLEFSPKKFRAELPDGLSLLHVSELVISFLAITTLWYVLATLLYRWQMPPVLNSFAISGRDKMVQSVLLMTGAGLPWIAACVTERYSQNALLRSLRI